jgi:thiosulfate dehydrogenase [quinone] large subunit
MELGTKIGLFVLRVFVGAKFIFAAWQKVWPGFSFKHFEQGWLKQPALEGFLRNAAETMRPELGFYKDMLEKFFIPQAKVMTYVIVGGELLVGVALVLGLLTRISSFFGLFMTASFFLATLGTGALPTALFNNNALAFMILCFVLLVSNAGLAGGIDSRIRGK